VIGPIRPSDPGAEDPQISVAQDTVRSSSPAGGLPVPADVAPPGGAGTTLGMTGQAGTTARLAW
jgi:hypothetical protein